jgi:hypothetical protein
MVTFEIERKVSDEFDLSASNSEIAPSSPISLLSVLSENETKQRVLLPILRAVSDEFNFSASDNLMAPSVPMSFAVLSENETKQQVCYL